MTPEKINASINASCDALFETRDLLGLLRPSLELLMLATQGLEQDGRAAMAAGVLNSIDLLDRARKDFDAIIRNGLVAAEATAKAEAELAAEIYSGVGGWEDGK